MNRTWQLHAADCSTRNEGLAGREQMAAAWQQMCKLEHDTSSGQGRSCWGRCSSEQQLCQATLAGIDRAGAIDGHMQP